MLFSFLFFSCHNDLHELTESSESARSNFFSTLADNRKSLKRTLIGEKRKNPYTVENMNKAYKTLYGKEGNLKATHRYIMFKPTELEHYKKLAESSLNLYDYPLDHEVIEMGDYYRPENAPDNENYNLYAAAALDEEIPDVSLEELEQLYLNTADEELVREAITEAGYEPDIEGYIVDDPNGMPFQDSPEHPGPLVSLSDCSCVSSSLRNASGCIKVQDTQFSTSGNYDSYRAVRNVKVILKDSWFKEKEVYTNSAGCFSVSRAKFKNRAWVWVKFTHDRGHIRGVRNGWVSLWDWLFTVKDYVGVVYGPNFNNINVNYDHSTDEGSRAQHFWAAATVYNALHEYYEFARRFNLGTPPEGLDIYIGRDNGFGYAMMADKLTDKGGLFNKLFAGGVMTYSYMAGKPWLAAFAVLSGFSAIVSAEILPFFPDVYVGVKPLSSGVARTSDKIKNVAYHEFGHAAHYNNISPGFRNHYWIPNIGYIIQNGSYGSKSDNNSGKCAVIETWGAHIGNYIAHEAYGALSETHCVHGDGEFCILSIQRDTMSSTYLRGLEVYNPNETRDTDSWIPRGVLNDLIDFDGEDRPVLDECSGFNHQDFFNSLNDDVNNITEFKNRILLNTNFRQQIQVNQLFQQYGY
jgi:hypothetical protein